MKLGCNCLNFVVELQNPQLIANKEKGILEGNHSYFNQVKKKNGYLMLFIKFFILFQDILMITGNMNYKNEIYPGLMKNTIFGNWNIAQCLSCKVFTHATNFVSGVETCSSQLRASIKTWKYLLCFKSTRYFCFFQEVLDLKRIGKEEGRTYSKIFQICIPTVLNIPDNFSFEDADSLIDSRVMELIHKKVNRLIKYYYMGKLKLDLILVQWFYICDWSEKFWSFQWRKVGFARSQKESIMWEKIYYWSDAIFYFSKWMIIHKDVWLIKYFVLHLS